MIFLKCMLFLYIKINQKKPAWEIFEQKRDQVPILWEDAERNWFWHLETDQALLNGCHAQPTQMLQFKALGETGWLKIKCCKRVYNETGVYDSVGRVEPWQQVKLYFTTT